MWHIRGIRITPDRELGEGHLRKLATEVNDSAVENLGEDVLRQIAHDLVEQVCKNATIDWTVKETVRSRVKVIVKWIFRKYGCPPDKQAAATETILQQVELLAES